MNNMEKKKYESPLINLIEIDVQINVIMDSLPTTPDNGTLFVNPLNWFK